eukprot:168537-Amorphochlora_amoeboformis.AAC.1
MMNERRRMMEEASRKRREVINRRKKSMESKISKTRLFSAHAMHRSSTVRVAGGSRGEVGVGATGMGKRASGNRSTINRSTSKRTSTNRSASASAVFGKVRKWRSSTPKTVLSTVTGHRKPYTASSIKYSTNSMTSGVTSAASNSSNHASNHGSNYTFMYNSNSSITAIADSASRLDHPNLGSHAVDANESNTEVTMGRAGFRVGYGGVNHDAGKRVGKDTSMVDAKTMSAGKGPHGAPICDDDLSATLSSRLHANKSAESHKPVITVKTQEGTTDKLNDQPSTNTNQTENIVSDPQRANAANPSKRSTKFNNSETDRQGQDHEDDQLHDQIDKKFVSSNPKPNLNSKYKAPGVTRKFNFGNAEKLGVGKQHEKLQALTPKRFDVQMSPMASLKSIPAKEVATSIFTDKKKRKKAKKLRRQMEKAARDTNPKPQARREKLALSLVKRLKKGAQIDRIQHITESTQRHRIHQLILKVTKLEAKNLPKAAAKLDRLSVVR